MGTKAFRTVGIVVVLATFGLLAWAGPAAAAPPADEVTLVLYYGDGCPHCATERESLVGLQDRHPRLVVLQHEVWRDEANRVRLAAHAADLGFEPAGVPVTIVR